MALARCPLAWCALAVALALLAGRLEPEGWTLGPLSLLGWPLLLGALGLCLAALGRMRRHRTTAWPGRPAGRLVTDGVFGLSRNPIYLGFVLGTAGAACLADAPLGLPAAPALLLLIGRRFVRAEEAGLGQAFGDEFEAYRARTRRWI